jgi:hypothetical protein
MAAPGKWKAYEYTRRYIINGTHDFDTHALKLALFLSTSNANTLSVGTGVYGDLTNEHANANGYTTGGAALSALSVTHSGATATFTATLPTFTASGGSIVFRFGVIYVDATVNSIVKPIVGVCLADTAPADVTIASGNSLQWVANASGIYTLTGASTD